MMSPVPASGPVDQRQEADRHQAEHRQSGDLAAPKTMWNF